MNYRVASADSCFLGHLYRSGQIEQAKLLFDTVMVDQWILGEIRNRQKDVFPTIQRDLEKSAWLKLVTEEHLAQHHVLSIYKEQMDDMRYIFLPGDEGEKRGIALAKSLGIYFFLTDDEKDDGPYKTIRRGLISGMEALAFWDLIYLNVISGNFNHDEHAKSSFDTIASFGYEPPFCPSYGSKISQTWRHLKDTTWLFDWAAGEGIDVKRSTIKLLKTIKDNNWV